MVRQRNTYTDKLQGVCPSCKNCTSFTLLGIQRWPKIVAIRLGLPLEQAIFQCDSCGTSVIQDSILHDKPAQATV